MIKQEQELKVQTIVKLDFVDSLKCLFGRSLRITTKIIIPQTNEIEMFNHYATTEIVSTTTYFTKQSKPNFGYKNNPKEDDKI